MSSALEVTETSGIMPVVSHLGITVFGRTARDKRREARARGAAGARAALESFYYGFNTPSLDVLTDVWAQDSHIVLCNPIGGRLIGRAEITALYERLLRQDARVWVELGDITEYRTPGMITYTGREIGEYTRAGRSLQLHIRTTRVFTFNENVGGWRLIHHHGSIDDPILLANYQREVHSRSNKGDSHG